jgi:hypothetical protein
MRAVFEASELMLLLLAQKTLSQRLDSLKN